MSDAHVEARAVEALRSINLNSLVALLALLETESVSAAAARAGITQSAMSHALRQLRERFGDPLLVRARGRWTRTPRAQALAPALGRALAALSAVVEAPAPWDPATARRRFTVFAGDYVALVLLPPLLERLGRLAPGISLSVRTNVTSPEEALERGDLDAAVVRIDGTESPLCARKLVEDGLACAVRRGHPGVGKRLTLARYLALPHVLISPQGSGPGIVDEVLAERGLTRHIALYVPSFLVAPLVVERSDLVVTAPRHMIEALAPLHAIDVHPPPLPLPRFSLHLLWHPRVHEDPGHQWLRAELARAAGVR